jgi:hypothetical protein
VTKPVLFHLHTGDATAVKENLPLAQALALVGMCEPRFVDLNNVISDDVESRIERAKLDRRTMS